METLLKDIRYGFRGLLKRPAFTIVALVILALGIGANTAIFTLLNAVVLKPLPVHKPDELVLFNDLHNEGTSTMDEGDIPTGRTKDLREEGFHAVEVGVPGMRLRAETGARARGQSQDADESFCIFLVVAVVHGEGRKIGAVKRIL